jgi:hypothetical protein
MGGKAGLFGSGNQGASSASKMTQNAKYGENDTLGKLRDISMSKTPTIGQQYMTMFNDQANQQAMALAASQRGASNPALAFRQAQLANQQMGLQNTQQAAIMGQQERQMADQMILSQAAAQRGVQLQSAMANQQAEGSANARNLQFGQQVVSGIGQGAASAAMLSDENEKKNIEPKKYAMEEIQEFLKALKPSTYEYKNAQDGGGEKMGIMAQDLEKSEVGKTMVDTGPDGKKRVDVNKSIGAIMAAMADMASRVKKLEK